MADENKQNPNAPGGAPEKARLPNAPINQGDPNAARRSEEAHRASQDKARQAQAENLEQEREMRANYPQQTGNPDQVPTPTQQENDEIRAGIRHIDDKQDDGSGPDPADRHAELRRRLAAEQNQSGGQQNKDYKTR